MMQPEHLSQRGVRRSDRSPLRGFDWSVRHLAGRVGEISGRGDSAVLTLAFMLVRDAQRCSEPVAWVGRRESTFFPPDAAEAGADLDALIIIRATRPEFAIRSADRLLRSGGFGLVIVDLGPGSTLPLPILARLSGLARTHRSALVFLTEKPGTAASLGPLVSVVARARRRWVAGDRFSCWIDVIKDKHGSPMRTKGAEYLGPPGVHQYP